jgi:NAD(P)-dependent dehydrogenase (short-subunit alcohol dehydrogenase family)
MSTVIITGAGGRLGRVVASRFGELGHRVVGVDTHLEGVELKSAYEADLSDEKDVEAVFSRIWSEHKSPGVLVHTVGMWDGRPLLDTSVSQWENVIEVNLTTTFLVFREALRRHEASGTDGEIRLIAFASAQGADRGLGEQAAYSAAKAGVIRLVESVASEYRDSGVTAHAIAPSMILFGGMEDEPGISAHELASLCLVIADAGGPLTGTTIRAYGSRS